MRWVLNGTCHSNILAAFKCQSQYKTPVPLAAWIIVVAALFRVSREFGMQLSCVAIAFRRALLLHQWSSLSYHSLFQAAERGISKTSHAHVLEWIFMWNLHIHKPLGFSHVTIAWLGRADSGWQCVRDSYNFLGQLLDLVLPGSPSDSQETWCSTVHYLNCLGGLSQWASRMLSVT